MKPSTHLFSTVYFDHFMRLPNSWVPEIPRRGLPIPLDVVRPRVRAEDHLHLRVRVPREGLDPVRLVAERLRPPADVDADGRALDAPLLV